jgi:hypothetical protein
MEAIRRATGKANPHGTNQHGGHGNTTSSTVGTTATNTLRRLKRDRPDLAERVVAGEISANAAAIEAGFRKPPARRLKTCPHCGGEL